MAVKLACEVSINHSLTVILHGVIPAYGWSTIQLKNYMTLTKRDLVVRISEETRLTQQDVSSVVQKTLNHISEALSDGDKVELRNFGIFEVRTRKARVGRNPKAPETDVPIPARSVVRFKAGKEMAERVIKLPPKTK